MKKLIGILEQKKIGIWTIFKIYISFNKQLILLVFEIDLFANGVHKFGNRNCFVGLHEQTFSFFVGQTLFDVLNLVHESGTAAKVEFALSFNFVKREALHWRASRVHAQRRGRVKRRFNHHAAVLAHNGDFVGQ